MAGHIGDPAAARAALADPAPTVRATALAALARLNSVEPSEVLAGLRDSEPSVRRRACAVAIPFLEIDLVPLLHDEASEVAEQAAWALGERAEDAGKAAVTALASLVAEHEDALTREAAVAALGAIGDPVGLPAILIATRDKPAVRRRAVLALAPFEGPEVETALERAKSDRDWQVRQAAEDLS